MIMKKKKYIKPALIVINMNPVQLICASPIDYTVPESEPPYTGEFE